MANPEHLARIVEGIPAFNLWRARNPAVLIDLSGMDLDLLNLDGANLMGANLSDSKLGKTGLSGVDLSDAQLVRAVLPGANLTGALLNRTNLSGAVFHGAFLRDTIFANTDLSTTKGLEDCVHIGPSSLGLDTIFRSGGDIPAAFLRGCGVPEQFIIFAKSLVGPAIEFYSCFISYSSKDQEFAERLHADLQAAGVRCWFAPHNIQGGRKIHDRIYEAIRLYDRLVLILSDDSMNSEWVKTEIAHARQKEVNQKRQVLFQLSIVEYARVRAWKCPDGDTGKDAAREIREYFIPDFSNWKNHDSYSKAFKRLLRDLTAQAAAASK